MPDDMLERRLRAALHSEGDALGMTITAAELERRLALRRRDRPSRVAAAVLAAAIGVGLMGVAGAAAGLFDRAPSVPVAPSAEPSASPVPGEPSADASSLPSIDDVLATLDPATIVRAQSFGPASGPPATEIPGPRTMGFAPVDIPGTYRVYTACRGPEEMNLNALSSPGGGTADAVSIPVRCDGSLTERQIHLGAGNVIEFTSPGPASWRIVVEAEPRSSWHATSLAPMPDLDAGQSILVEGASQRSDPSYEVRIGAAPVARNDVGAIPPRDSYRVSVACAGPVPISYAFSGDVSGEPADAWTTTVECDGAFHEDVLDLPLPDGSVLSITADARTAWQVAVMADAPPVSIEPDRPGWQLAIAMGPDLNVRGTPIALSSLIDRVDSRIRVVVSCEGGNGVDVVVHPGGTEAAAVGSFRAACQADGVLTTAREFDLPGSAFTIATHPDGRMWLVVTVQQPDSGPFRP